MGKTLYEKSGAAEFDVTREEFAVWLAELPQTESMRLPDLVLARACAAGKPVAGDCFVARYRQKLYRAGAAMLRDELRGCELVDSLWADLYSKRPSKLESYMGRGSLEGWLKTVLAQEHINRIRQQRKFVAFDDAIETPVQFEMDDPGLCNQQRALTLATDAVLANLSAEDRFFLAAYYLDQRTLAEIGRMVSMHESTVSRRLDKITAAVRRQIITKLGKSGIPKRTADEMLALDVRDLPINVREKLAQERRA